MINDIPLPKGAKKKVQVDDGIPLPEGVVKKKDTVTPATTSTDGSATKSETPLSQPATILNPEAQKLYQEGKPQRIETPPFQEEAIPKEPVPIEKEQNFLKTFGKSAWNVMRYQLPSAAFGAWGATHGAFQDIIDKGSLYRPFELDAEGRYIERQDQPLKPLSEFTPWEQAQIMAERQRVKQSVKKDLITVAQKFQNEGAQYTQGLVNTLDKVESPLDALNWVSNAVGQATAQIPMSAATVGATGFLQEIGSIYLDGVQKAAEEQSLKRGVEVTPQDIIREGLDQPALAVSFGLAAGALDYVGAGKVMNQFTKSAFADELRERGMKLLLSGGETVLTESLTEGAQTAMEQAAAQMSAGKGWDEIELDTKEIFESMAQGGVGAGGITATGALIGKMTQGKPIKEDLVGVPATEVERQVATMVANGVIDQATAEKIITEKKTVDEADAKVPQEIQNRKEVVPLVARKSELEKELENKTIPPQATEAKIEAIDREYNEKTGAPLTEKEQKELEKLQEKQEAKPAEGEKKKELTESEKATLEHLEKRKKKAAELLKKPELQVKAEVTPPVANKSDIENRREKELTNLKKGDKVNRYDENGNLIGELIVENVNDDFVDFKNQKGQGGVRTAKTLLNPTGREKGDSYRISNYEEINAKYDAELAALKPAIPEAQEGVIKTETDAVQIESTASSLLREQGIRGEGGLQGVEQQDQPEKPAELRTQSDVSTQGEEEVTRQELDLLMGERGIENPDKLLEKVGAKSLDELTESQLKEAIDLVRKSDSFLFDTAPKTRQFKSGGKTFRKVGQGLHTKGVWKSSDGKTYKSLEGRNDRKDTPKADRGKTFQTDEHKMLSKLQGEPLIPKIGEVIDTPEGKMMEIETLQEAKEITKDEYKQVLDALDNINKKGVRYGDRVKVMRDAKGNIKIVDFSSAREIDPSDYRYPESVDDVKKLVKDDGATYKYYLTQRPPSIGTYPSGKTGDIVETEHPTKNGRRAWIIEYKLPLSDSEIAEYELLPLDKSQTAIPKAETEGQPTTQADENLQEERQRQEALLTAQEQPAPVSEEVAKPQHLQQIDDAISRGASKQELLKEVARNEKKAQDHEKQLKKEGTGTNAYAGIRKFLDKTLPEVKSYIESKFPEKTKPVKTEPKTGGVGEFQYVINKANKSGESAKGSGTKKVNLSDKEAAIFYKTIEKLEKKAVENNGASFDESETINFNYEKINGKEQKINTYNIDGYEIKYKYNSGESFTEIRTPQGDLIIVQKQYGKTEIAYLGNNKEQVAQGEVKETKTPKTKSVLQKSKGQTQRDKVLKAESTIPRHEVLKYFLGGGRINTKDFKGDTSFGSKSKKDGKTRGVSEFRKRIWAHSNDAPTMDRLVMQIKERWETDYGATLDEGEVRNMIIDVLNQHDTKSGIESELAKEFSVGDEVVLSSMEREQKKLEQEYADMYEAITDAEKEFVAENDDVARFWDDVDMLTEEEAQKLLGSDEDYKNYLNLLADENSEPAIGKGATETQDTARPDEVKTSDKRKAELEAELTEVNAQLSEAELSLQKAQKSLDKDLKAKQGDMFAGGPQKSLIDDTAEKKAEVDRRRKVVDALKEKSKKLQEQADDILKGQTRMEINETPFDKAASASSRFRPKEIIVFEKPIVGKSGAQLVSYEWKWMPVSDIGKEGDEVMRRVSDWTQAETSAETGRDIVHQFTVKMPNGDVKTVSSESVLELLGYTEKTQPKNIPSLVNAVKTLAKQKMKLAALEARIKERNDAIAEINKKPRPKIKKEYGEVNEFGDIRAEYTMGDASVLDYVKSVDAPISEERMSTLESSYISEELRKMGIEPYGNRSTNELKNQIERQERRIKNLTEQQEGVELTAEERIQQGKDKLKKIATGKTGKAYDITGLTAEVLDALYDVARGYAELGVEKGIDGLKEFKKWLKEETESDLTDKDIEEIYEKANPKEEAKEEREPSRIKKTLVTKRAYEGSVREGVKKELEKIGLTREIENLAEAQAKAKEFVASVGEEAALDAIRSNDVDGAMAAYVFNEVAESIDNKINTEKDQATLDELNAMQAALLEEWGKRQRAGGAFNSAMQTILPDSILGFNLEKRIQDYKDINAGVIPADVEARFREYDRQLKEVNQKLAEAEQRAKEAEEKAAIQNIKESVEREKKTRKEPKIYGRTRVQKGLSDLVKALGEPTPGMALASKLPSVAKALAEIGQGLIEEGKATYDNVIEKIEDYLNDNFKGRVDFEKYRDEITQRFKDIQAEAAKIKIPHSVIRDLVERGIDNINDLTKAIMEQFPDATERQVRDAITGYGKTANLSQDEIEMQIRKMKRIGKHISAMEDVQAGKRPLRSGLQRDKLTDEERRMQRELREAMKDLPVDEAEMEKAWKTALDAIKTRLKNQISDLENQLATGEKTAKKKGVEYDDEAKALRDQRDELKRAIEEIEGKPEMTDEERVKRAIASAERATRMVEDRIAKGELEKAQNKVPETPELKAAREQLKAARERLRQLQADAGIAEKKRLELTKKSVERRINELQRRIREKDFVKKERKPVIADTELNRLRAEKIRIQEEYEKEFYKAKLQNRTTAEKVKDHLWDAWNLTRALRATGEFSFVLLQGLINTIAHPIQASQAMKNALTFMASPKKTEEWLSNLRAQEYYPILKESKLSITEPNAEITAREELFYSGWTDMIWNNIGKIFGKNADTWRKLNPLHALERASVGYLDTQRVLRFLDGMEMLKEKGIEFQDNKQAYKDMADVINTFTGRASIGKLDPQILSKVFFSPRNWASSIKTATPYAFYHFGKMRSGAEAWKPSVAQKMAIADFTKFVGFTTSMVAMAALALNDDDDEETKVELDPRSSDFGKIKLGDTRIDPWGGRIQQIVFLSRMISDSIKNAKGDIVPLGTPYKAPTRAELMLQMATNKLAPSASILEKYLTSKEQKDGTRVDKFGQPYDITEEMKENLYPIYWETVSELLKDDPNAMNGLLIFYAFFGGGVNVYEPKPEKEKKEAKQLTPEERKNLKQQAIEQSRRLREEFKKKNQ